MLGQEPRPPLPPVTIISPPGRARSLGIRFLSIESCVRRTSAAPTYRWPGAPSHPAVTQQKPRHASPSSLSSIADRYVRIRPLADGFGHN